MGDKCDPRESHRSIRETKKCVRTFRKDAFRKWKTRKKETKKRNNDGNKNEINRGPGQRAERERRTEANSGLHAAKSFIPDAIVRFSLVVLCHHTSCLTICPRIRFPRSSLSLRIHRLSFFHVALFPSPCHERAMPSKKPSLEQYFRADRRSRKKSKNQLACVWWREQYPAISISQVKSIIHFPGTDWTEADLSDPSLLSLLSMVTRTTDDPVVVHHLPDSPWRTTPVQTNYFLSEQRPYFRSTMTIESAYNHRIWIAIEFNYSSLETKEFQHVKIWIIILTFQFGDLELRDLESWGANFNYFAHIRS